MTPSDRPSSPPSSASALARPARASLPRIGEWLGLASVPKRRLARLRRLAARALLVVPFALVVGHDLSLRSERIAGYDHVEAGFYLLSAALSAAFWCSALVAASRRRSLGRWGVRIFAVLTALFAVGAQAYTFSRYQTYMDHQSVLVGTSMMPSIWQQLSSDWATFTISLLPPVALALVLPLVITTLAPSRPTRAKWATDTMLLALGAALLISPEHGGVQGQTPDIMYVSALGQLARARWDHNETVERVHPGPRSPLPLPDLRATPAAPRDVVFVLTESVRAMSECVAYDPKCKWTPFSNEEAPNRLPLLQMRSVDSTTAISLSVMWDGLPPESTREEMHSAPLLWEYAHAAQLDTGYFTSQNLLFGNSGAWLEGVPLTRRVSATELEPDATLEVGADDGKLVDYTTSEIGALHEPYFAVVHLSNTHFPYKVDPKYAPFQPEEEATGPGYETEIRNRYQDAIYAQDRAVGRLIRAIRARPEGNRVVIVFLSDHGEQMREKGAVGHTGTLFEEEVRIPAWIDAPEGTLTAEEKRHLTDLRDAPVTTLDVMPTMLDLMGVYDEPRIATFRAKIPGKSLLRGGSSADKPVFLSNCTELWQCAFKNWGAIRGEKKLIANQGERTWSCFDLEHDPSELHALDASECGDLQSLAEAKGHGRPF